LNSEFGISPAQLSWTEAGPKRHGRLERESNEGLDGSSRRIGKQIYDIEPPSRSTIPHLPFHQLNYSRVVFGRLKGFYYIRSGKRNAESLYLIRLRHVSRQLSRDCDRFAHLFFCAYLILRLLTPDSGQSEPILAINYRHTSDVSPLLPRSC
jgi:hypothetical protein